ncbi:MAG: hypothetical protein KatS3mg105_3740 [Gemmatales bacterium]|nr:MAG: hypothetical protein KatS3mg105_3740 [Gemmatales bacterium]
MRTELVAAVVAVSLASGVQKVQAAGCCVPVCCTAVKWVEKKVVCYKPVWREKEVTCTVMQKTWREVVEKKKVTVMVPEVHHEKRQICVMKAVPKEIEQDVVCRHLVAEKVKDACTGCVYTVCKPVCTVKKVKMTVFEYVPEKREVTVAVCRMKPVEKEIECRRYVPECKPVTVVQKQRYCEMVPVESTIRIPVCCP